MADSAERVFVGGLPYYLTDEQCKELLGSFAARPPRPARPLSALRLRMQSCAAVGCLITWRA